MTIDEIITAVKGYGYSDDLTSVIENAINAADRDIQGSARYPWNEARATGAIVANERTINYADLSFQGDRTFSRVDAVYFTDLVSNPDYWSNARYENPDVVLEEFQLNPSATGPPEIWSMYNGQIIFYPNADGPYTVVADVILTSDFEKLASAANTYVPRTPVDYHDLYVFYAVRLLAARERDWSQFQFADRQYKELKQQMISNVGLKQRQNSTHVRQSHFYDG